MKKIDVIIVFLFVLVFTTSCGNSKKEDDAKEIGRNLHEMYYENNTQIRTETNSTEELQSIIENNENDYVPSEVDKEYLESEINRLESTIASMQSQLEYIYSETQRMYLSSQIVEMQTQLEILRRRM